MSTSTQQEHDDQPMRQDTVSPDQSEPGNGEEGAYPPGFEPELTGKALEVARRKERGYTWLVRFQLVFMVAIVVLIIYFIVTS